MNQQKKVRKLLKRVEILDSSFDTDDNVIPKQRINNKMKYRKNNIIENSSSKDNLDESFKDNLKNHDNTEYSVGGKETIDKDPWLVIFDDDHLHEQLKSWLRQKIYFTVKFQS